MSSSATQPTDTEQPQNPGHSDTTTGSDQQKGNCHQQKPKKGTEEFDINTQTQMSFGEDGSLEPSEETVEVTLDQYDFDIDTTEKESRIDQPRASGLMADDRPQKSNTDSSRQKPLFLDANEEQQTLDGESARNQCLFD